MRSGSLVNFIGSIFFALNHEHRRDITSISQYLLLGKSPAVCVMGNSSSEAPGNYGGGKLPESGS